MSLHVTRTTGGLALCALSAVAVAGTAAVFAPAPRDAGASSHREAPAISEDPSADNTDLYAFRDRNAPSRLNIIANWSPAEDPAAGPMYNIFSPTARYFIKIDTNGDAKADLTYRYVFQKPANALFLRRTSQAFTVTRTTRAGSVTSKRLRTPSNYVGPRTNSATGVGSCGEACYRRGAARAVYNLPTDERIFAGQRDDAFFADIGQIFDHLGFRRGTGITGGGKDFFAGYAVHTVAMQIPIPRITTKTRKVVGIWATTERQRVTVRNGRAIRQWVQVSRIGNPLVNELLIPTERKDEWNAQMPHQDREFVTFTQNPLPAKAINMFYPGVINAPEKNRSDITAIILTGLPKLNFTGKTPADMLRVNLAIRPTATENRLGVLGGDLQGWPNGRRLGDDVIDIAEQAVAGATATPANPNARLLGDGVDTDDRNLLPIFPYEADPRSGAENAKGLQKP